jgi:hypothetical protein
MSLAVWLLLAGFCVRRTPCLGRCASRDSPSLDEEEEEEHEEKDTPEEGALRGEGARSEASDGYEGGGW